MILELQILLIIGDLFQICRSLGIRGVGNRGSDRRDAIGVFSRDLEGQGLQGQRPLSR